VVDDVAEVVEALPRELGRALDRYREERRRVDEADGVAVGRRRRERREADLAARAGPVDDHDFRAAEVFLDIGRERPGDEIGSAARRVRDDQGDRTFGIRGMRGLPRRQQERNEEPHRSSFSTGAEYDPARTLALTK